MTAPDPTAGEGDTCLTANCDPCTPKCVALHARLASPPAVAASTGTSEDVEAPNVVQRIVDAWDCCETCAGGVLARHVAAREAAARAEALREAADAAWSEYLIGPAAHDYLRERANLIEGR